ncbi:MAG: endonuclease III, partial [Phycisphaerales bacterium]
MIASRTRSPDKAAARLFAVLQTPQDFADADPEQIARLIYPVGMYRQKAKNLIR